MKRVISTTFATMLTAFGLVGLTAAQQFDLGNFLGGRGGQQFSQQQGQQFQQPSRQFGQQLQQAFVQNAGGFVDQLGQQMRSEGIVNGQGGRLIIEPPIIDPPHIVEPPCTVNPPNCTLPPQPIAPAWQSRPWNQPMYAQTQTLEYRSQPEPFLPAQPEAVTDSGTETAGETPLEALEEVESGSVISIEGKNLGAEPGGVYLKFNEMVMETKLVGWSDSVAQAELPSLPIVGASRAILIVMTAESTIGQTMEVRLVPTTVKAPAAEVAVDETDEEEVEYQEDASDDEVEMISGGETLSLEGELGTAEGTVALRIASMNFRSKIIKWTESSVEFEVPALDTTEVQAAELVIRNSDNQVVDTYEVSYAAGHK